jgi:hypothetical protein
VTTLRFARDMLIAGLLGLIAGLTLASLTGCTPAQQEMVGTSTRTAITATKIAACVQAAIAEEELERVRERRLAEAEAEEQAEAIREAAREHPGSVKDEVEKVLKDGAPK